MTEDRTRQNEWPLSRWQRVWRYLGAVLLGALAFGDLAPDLWANHPVWFWSDLALGAACLALLPFRRRWPVPVTGLISLVGFVSATSAGAFVVAFISLCTHRKWRQIIPMAVLNLVVGVTYFSIAPAVESTWLASVVFNVVVVAVLVATGMYVGARRELVTTLRDRADRAEREQTLRVAQAKTYERARIAREMHDVLAHRMSLVAMHSGALAYRTDLDPEETRSAAEVIQTNAQLALTDLREVLGVLRGDDEPADPARPLPTLSDVPVLIVEARTAGMRVTLDNQVTDLTRAPEAVGRHAYRMIQEGLTNARKHAPDTAVHVRLAGAAGDQLTVEVRNPLRVGADPSNAEVTPASGLGLVGLAERATLSGGRFEHGPDGSSQFVVRAWLPWPA